MEVCRHLRNGDDSHVISSAVIPFSSNKVSKNRPTSWACRWPNWLRGESPVRDVGCVFHFFHEQKEQESVSVKCEQQKQVVHSAIWCSYFWVAVVPPVAMADDKQVLLIILQTLGVFTCTIRSHSVYCRRKGWSRCPSLVQVYFKRGPMYVCWVFQGDEKCLSDRRKTMIDIRTWTMDRMMIAFYFILYSQPKRLSISSHSRTVRIGVSEWVQSVT